MVKLKTVALEAFILLALFTPSRSGFTEGHSDAVGTDHLLLQVGFAGREIADQERKQRCHGLDGETPGECRKYATDTDSVVWKRTF